jgi:hypothetical protein
VTGLQESGHDPSHHLSQEGVGRDVDRHAKPFPPDADPMHGPDRLPVRRPEGAKVVTANQDRPDPLHRGDIQRVPHPERETLAEWASRPVPDGVAILPASRRVAWMEPDRGAAHLSKRYVRWQQRVERPCQLLGRSPHRIGECDHLPDSVHPGVGSACRLDPDPASAGDPSQSSFEFSLDRPGPRLDLVPGEVRAVIFNRCAIAHRGVLSDA